jgi:hypothetical protein
MREIRQSGSEGGARFNPSFLPLSAENRADAIVQQGLQFRPVTCQRWIKVGLSWTLSITAHSRTAPQRGLSSRPLFFGCWVGTGIAKNSPTVLGSSGKVTEA